MHDLRAEAKGADRKVLGLAGLGLTIRHVSRHVIEPLDQDAAPLQLSYSASALGSSMLPPPLRADLALRGSRLVLPQRDAREEGAAPREHERSVRARRRAALSSILFPPSSFPAASSSASGGGPRGDVPEEPRAGACKSCDCGAVGEEEAEEEEREVVKGRLERMFDRVVEEEQRERRRQTAAFLRQVGRTSVREQEENVETAPAAPIDSLRVSLDQW